MGRLRLYGYWRSSASYRVRIALAVKGLDYEYVPVHLVRDGGEQFGAAYTRLNPQSRVPALELDGVVLTQSMAILEWLEEAFPGAPPLLPAEPLARARVRSLAQLVVADIQPLQNTAVIRYLRERHGWAEPEVGSWMQEWIGRGLRALEQRLAGEPRTGRFCDGDTPTLADVCLVPQAYASRRFGIDLAAFPRIAAIDAACRELEPFRRAAPEQQPDAGA
ncbi:MAG: maleylacetoacetate isomerase [Steroidobacteraceae bacterium]|jgi:maleylacetoacetate isomerase|nr:maleylacetoacetate isomerase [Steroidobacteraceae bacterium]